jgi:multiple sugar transport system substrate-binding protein
MRTFASITLSFIVALSLSVLVGAAPVTIQWAHWFGGVDLENAQKAVEQFERENPDIKVEMQIIDFGAYWEKLQILAAAGTLPDVILTISSRAQEWIMPGVIVENLQPFIDRDLTATDLRDFWPSLMLAYRDQAGNTYALPYDVSMFVLWYNANLLSDRGLTLPSPTTPLTWDEWLTQARRITRDVDGDGRADEWGLANMPRDWGLFGFLGQNYARIFSEDRLKSAINSVEAKEVFQWWVDARMQYGINPPPGVSNPGFTSGRIGFQLEGPWSIPGVRQSARFDFDVAPLPQGKRRYNVIDGGALAMGKDTKHAEAAWRFIRFYTSRENLEAVMGLPGRGIPGRISAARSFVTEAMPNEQIFLNEISHTEPVGYLVPPNWRSISGLIDGMANRIFSGDISVTAGLETLHAQLNTAISEFMQRLNQ